MFMFLTRAREINRLDKREIVIVSEGTQSATTDKASSIAEMQYKSIIRRYTRRVKRIYLKFCLRSSLRARGGSTAASRRLFSDDMYS